MLRGAERIVATGNGAAYYVAHALWLASLESRGSVPIVAVPCGIAVRDGFSWQPGDAVLAVSSSGEFRDVVEIARRSGERPCVAITAASDSSLAAAATRRRRCSASSRSARSPTRRRWQARTRAASRCGPPSPATPSWPRWWPRRPTPPSRRSPTREAWAPEVGSPPAAIAVGGGPAWAAALELALMLKEISRIPAEGVETREGATSAMFGLDRGHLMVSLDPEGDADGDEAVRLCAAAGAVTLRLPGADDPRLAPITTLPAAAALSAQLALAAGHDVDRPAWTDAYYETAR